MNGWREVLAELREAHAEEIEPAAYAAVRARVLAELRRRRRGWWIRAAAGAAAAMTGLVVGERMRVEELRVVARAPEIPAADLRIGRMPPRRAARSPHRREEIVVKIETGDPDVVIYWIAEAKGEE